MPFDVPSLRVGRLFGIPLEVNASWLVIFTIVMASLGGQYYPSIAASEGASTLVYYVVGALTSLLFFASIVAHELCHSLVAKLGGGRVEKITLFIFGGVAQIEDEPKTPAREFVMASAGPLMSLALGGVFLLVTTAALRSHTAWWIWAPARYLMGINFAVGVFNLLPGFPLDGGRVLRSVLWWASRDLLKATRWAVRSGQVIGWSMALLAILGVLNGSAQFIWLGIVGWFVASLAGQSYRQQLLRTQLEGITVAQVMGRAPEYVDGSMSLEQFAHEYLLAGRHSRYPVMLDGNIVGLVAKGDATRVDRASWSSQRVLDVADRNLKTLVISEDEMVNAVLGHLVAEDAGALLVAKDGRLVGMLTRADILRALHS